MKNAWRKAKHRGKQQSEVAWVLVPIQGYMRLHGGALVLGQLIGPGDFPLCAAMRAVEWGRGKHSFRLQTGNPIGEQCWGHSVPAHYTTASAGPMTQACIGFCVERHTFNHTPLGLQLVYCSQILCLCAILCLRDLYVLVHVLVLVYFKVKILY